MKVFIQITNNRCADEIKAEYVYMTEPRDSVQNENRLV